MLEFKQKSAIAAADCDQCLAYANDLASYHPGCRDCPVMPLLILTRCNKPAELRSDAPSETQPVSPEQLQAILMKAASAKSQQSAGVDPQAWAAAEYAPLPTVIQAARQIFQREPLSSIRRAESAGIPELLETLNRNLPEYGVANDYKSLLRVKAGPCISIQQIRRALAARWSKW